MMNDRSKSFKNSKGVTVMEALIGAALVSLVVTSLYSSLSGAMRNVNESRIRLVAMSIANEKMEIFRNLAYNNIGTIGGIISGPIAQKENITRNGRSFEIKNDVRYIDDSFDGFFPDDLVNTDYKKVQITVSWSGSPEKSILTSIFVPSGIETNLSGGTLSVNVVDSAAEPLAGVNINLVDMDNNPNIEADYTTDASGNLILPGVPAQHYRITLTKDGYQTVSTYPDPPMSSFTPINSDFNIVAENLNTKLFFMDLSANLTFKALNIKNNNGIEGVTLDIEGGEKIGIEPETFIIDSSKTTNTAGEVVFSDSSSGLYRVKNIDSLSTSQYEYLGSSEGHPFNLQPGEDKTIALIFADSDADSLVVNIKESFNEEPLEGASIRLSGENFSEAVISGTNGLVYFPSIADSLAPGDYLLEISKEGYVSQSKTISINKLIKEDILLIAN